MQMPDVNYRWFSERLREKRLTQRALAKLLEMDPSSLSLLLHGKRRMRVEQAAEIARFIGVPVADVMRHGGADVRENASASVVRTVPVVGWVDGDSKVTLDWSQRDQFFEVNADVPPSAVAIQWRTAQTAAGLYDGWMMVTLPPSEPDPTMMLGKLGMCGLKDGEGTLVRFVRKGYRPGRYNLLSMSAPPMNDVELAWFSPVLMIMPPE